MRNHLKSYNYYKSIWVTFVNGDAAFAKTTALFVTITARHHHQSNEPWILEFTLFCALSYEAHGHMNAAITKTAVIKIIQKALTAKILKRLDEGHTFVEVARKMLAIEGMQLQINDMERRLSIM